MNNSAPRYGETWQLYQILIALVIRTAEKDCNIFDPETRLFIRVEN